MSPLSTAPAGLRSADTALRARYLNEVLRLLYPAGDPPSDGTVPDGAEFVIVPNARQPRLLVPAASRRLAAAAVRRYAEPQGRLARLKRNAVVAALRTGAAGVLLRDRVSVAAGGDTIDAYLREALAVEVSVSLHIGPARANRKPVLQLLRPDGSTLGFAKIGPTSLTRRLVEAETVALERLARARLRTVSVPEVLHAGQWRGHAVLVQSALPIWLRRAALGRPRLTAAMREIASVDGTARAPLAESPYWSTLRARLDAITDQADGRALADAATALVASTGATILAYGCWHGDWSPWNMAGLDDTLLLWDWERFATGVPMGFDALHFALQRALQSSGFRGSVDAAKAVDACIDGARRQLAPFGVRDAGAANLTALLYLTDLATRYLTDRQADAGARLGVLGTWLLPVLLRRIGTIEREQGTGAGEAGSGSTAGSGEAKR